VHITQSSDVWIWQILLQRDFRVKMWGTSSSDDKLADDFGNAIEGTRIGGRRSDLLQQEN
jgi:hypothetical protein